MDILLVALLLALVMSLLGLTWLVSKLGGR
jgi:hypothetical protein